MGNVHRVLYVNRYRKFVPFSDAEAPEPAILFNISAMLADSQGKTSLGIDGSNVACVIITYCFSASSTIRKPSLLRRLANSVFRYSAAAPRRPL